VGQREGRTNEYEELHASGIDVPGRLTLNLWRLLRSELKLGTYTQVNVVLRLHRLPQQFCCQLLGHRCFCVLLLLLMHALSHGR